MKCQRLSRAGWVGVVVLLGLTVLLSGCGTASNPWEEVTGDKDARRVLVSFPPLYCFASKVAGNHARVLCLATTIGPHEYSPTGQDALKAVKADLLLVNGLGLDNWISKVKNSSGNLKLPVVEVGETIPQDLLLRTEEADEPHGPEGHHHHGDHDPHAWLGIDQAIAMVNVIRDRLKEIDPEHKSDFDKNAADYVVELQKLQEYGRSKIPTTTNRTIIPMHDSMRYFAKSFGLQILESIQGTAGVDADTPRLKKLVEQAVAKKARVITVEPQYSHVAAENLSKQIEAAGVKDVRIVVFDTLETAPSLGELTPDLYRAQMQQNIDNLAKALQ